MKEKEMGCGEGLCNFHRFFGIFVSKWYILIQMAHILKFTMTGAVTEKGTNQSDSDETASDN